MSSECLVQFTEVVSPAQSGQILGQKVLWKGEKKKFIGKIVGFHGKNGAVRVKFKKGVPGQALGTIVELIGQRISLSYLVSKLTIIVSFKVQT